MRRRASDAPVMRPPQRRRRRRVGAEGIMLYTALNLAFEHNVVLRLLSLGQIMTLDDVQTKRLRAVGLGSGPMVCEPKPRPQTYEPLGPLIKSKSPT